jgi:hypothetical protein
MARATLALASATAGNGAAGFNFRATRRSLIYEVGIFQPGTGTATVVAGGIGKPANSGSVAASSTTAGVITDLDVAASGLCATAWSTAPTAPSPFLRRFSIPATLGAGVIFTFPRGIYVAEGADFCIWNSGGTTWLAQNVYIDWEE